MSEIPFLQSETGQHFSLLETHIKRMVSLALVSFTLPPFHSLADSLCNYLF